MSGVIVGRYPVAPAMPVDWDVAYIMYSCDVDSVRRVKQLDSSGIHLGSKFSHFGRTYERSHC